MKNTGRKIGTLDHTVTNFLLGGARYQLAVRQGDAGFRVIWGVNTDKFCAEDLSRPFLWLGPGEAVEIKSHADSVEFCRHGCTMHVTKTDYGVGHVNVENTKPITLSCGPPGIHYNYGFLSEFEYLLYYPDPLNGNIRLDIERRQWWSKGNEYYLCLTWDENVKVVSGAAGLRLLLSPGTHTIGFAIGTDPKVLQQQSIDTQQRDFSQVRREVESSWEDILKRVPLPKEPALRDKSIEAWYFLAHAARTEPNGFVRHKITAVAPMGYHAQVFHWDSLFIAQTIDLFQPEWFMEMLRAIFEYTKPGHPVNGCYSTYYKPGPDDTQLPLQSWTVLKHYLRWNDLAFVEEVYHILHDDLWWWFTKRDLYDTGIPVSESCGYDNSVVFDILRLDKMKLKSPIMAPDVAGILVRESLSFEILAKVLGKTKDAEQVRLWAHRAVLSARKLLWHEADQILYCHDGERHIRVKAVFNLIGTPLLPRQKAARMLDRYVVPGSPMWPGLFGTTTASNEPGYDPNQFWRGPVWGGTLLLCSEMFHLSGFSDVANRAVKPFLEAVAKTAGFYEHYHPETGKGQRIPLILSLTAAPFVLMALGEDNNRQVIKAFAFK